MASFVERHRIILALRVTPVGQHLVGVKIGYHNIMVIRRIDEDAVSLLLELERLGVPASGDLGELVTVQAQNCHCTVLLPFSTLDLPVQKFLSSIVDKYVLAARVIAHVIRILSQFHCSLKREARAIKNLHGPVAFGGNKQTVDRIDIVRVLWIVERKRLHLLASLEIDNFESVIVKGGRE